MKAVVVHEFGGPEVLKLEDVPTPRPAGGQVLVRIRAVGVNPYDTYMRNGTYAVKPPLPYTPGSDGAGDVEAVGERVSLVKPGDRVYTAKTLTGAYAEYALTLESQVHSLPSNIKYAQGAAIWVPYGTAGTEKGLELVKREGAHHAFDHRTSAYRDQILQVTGGLGVDLILEMLANVNLGHDLKLLAPQGRVVVIGSRGDVSISPRDLMTRRGAIHAFTLWGISEDQESEIHASLLAGLGTNTLPPAVGN